MIKRTIAIFFILLANIIILAHAIFPHHHHNSQICFVDSHCQRDSEAHKYSDIELKHEHDGKNKEESCVLKQVVIIPTNRAIIEIKNSDCTDNPHNFDTFQNIIYNCELNPLVHRFISIEHGLLIASFYTHFVNSSLGLRGPPTL